MTDDLPSMQKDDSQGGVEPSTKSLESNKDAHAVPLGEHIEMRKELRALRDELAALKGGKEPPQKEPVQPATTQASDDQLRRMVEDMQRRERLRDIRSEFGLNDAQANAVMDVLAKNPALSLVEAKTVAVTRHAEAFAEAQPDGFDAGTHGVMRPRSVSQHPEPQPSDFKQRQKHLNEYRKVDREGAKQVLNNWIGSFAAKAVGKEHKLMPLPRQDR